MYGNIITRSLNVIKHIFKKPKFVPNWFYFNVTRKIPLEVQLPWISYPSIEYLEAFVKNTHKVFEFGGGGSTFWFANRCKEVICTENSRYWGEMIRDEYEKNKDKYLAKLIINIVEVSEYPKTEEYSQADTYVNKIVSDAPYDIILIDGIDGIEGKKNYRVECIKKAKDYLNKDGIIILDDSWRTTYSDVSKILNEYQRIEFWGLGPCRLGVTKTDIYVKKN